MNRNWITSARGFWNSNFDISWPVFKFKKSTHPPCVSVRHNFWQGTAWTEAIGHMRRWKSSLRAQSITRSQIHGNLQGWVNAQNQQTLFLTWPLCVQKRRSISISMNWSGHELAPQIGVLHCKMTHLENWTSTKVVFFFKYAVCVCIYIYIYYYKHIYDDL